MKTFTKKYQLWTQNDSENGYDFTEFDTLAECVAAEKTGDWYITKWVQLAVSEASETPVYTIRPPILAIDIDKVDEITDVDKEYERRQLGGPIAKLEG